MDVVQGFAFLFQGTPPKEASFAVHAMLMNHFMEGGYYPVGGASEIAMRLIPVIEKTGGRVLVRATVKEVLVDKGKGQVRGTVSLAWLTMKENYVYSAKFIMGKGILGIRYSWVFIVSLQV